MTRRPRCVAGPGPVTVTDLRLIYAWTERDERTASELKDRLKWSPAKLDQVAQVAVAEGWLHARPGDNHHGARYRAHYRPACCCGGFIPPTADQRAPADLLAHKQRAVS
jgi:hypothetical protein